jgi:ribosomal protein S18 acetylase RimI-like enzyme
LTISLSRFVTEEIIDADDAGFDLPGGLSFFDPYLRYFVRETIETGGEAFVTRAPDGAISGLFIYDEYEKTGTIFTRSREVFDHLCGLKPFSFIYAEVEAERESEVYDIYTIDLGDRPIVHRFSHEISMAAEEESDELVRFMASTHLGINRSWTKVALRNGDRCFTVRLGDQIAGLGWVSLVDGVGRFHSLYVKPQFRRMGMGEDILFARLYWLESKHARSAFSEISRDNRSSSRIALKGNMKPTGQVFQYSKRYVSEGKEDRIWQSQGT